jgi:DNA-binding winged helix-turn-helix (wHTH) protein
MLSFPPFRLDLESERLWKHDEELRLRRKPFAILRYLVQNPQRLVTHADIIQAVWGKIAMSESLLRTHVRDLRQVLGEGIVETVVGRGYRFVAELAHVYESDSGGGQQADRTNGSSANLVVDRDEEVGALRAALRATLDQKRTSVFLTGEAGIGKTTLVDHFLEEVGRDITLLVGRGACVEQYGSGQAYLPVLDAIAALCRRGDRVVEIFSRHAPTWLVQLPALLRTEQLEEVQRRTGGATHARTLRELVEALEALTRDAPVVLVMDDLHWTDPSTAELLAILASRREPARLLLLGTYRPAEVPRGHPLSRVVGELVAHRQASAVELEGFGVAGLEAYLKRRFQEHRFPSELTRTLAQTTRGNPLFVTTLVDDLVSQELIRTRDGNWELSTTVEDVAARRPDGIRRLIDTQIDRLSAADQRIIEAGAIAGMTFTVAVVAHALDADADSVDSSCESLANERRFLHYAGTETWPDGTIQSRYTFCHSLFQHAALARSTAATIRSKHRRIAERLEVGFAGREQDVAAELAVHFDQAQQPAKAVRYYLSAGELARLRYGLHEAVAHYERARGLLRGLSEIPERDTWTMRVMLRLGWCLFQRDGLTDAALPLLEKAKELATHLGDKAALSDALVHLQTLSIVRGDLRGASVHARAAAPLLNDNSSISPRMFAQEMDATLVLLRGDLLEACQLLSGLGVFHGSEERVVEGAEQRSVGMALGAYALWLTGKPDEAVALARRAYDAAEALNDPWDRAALLGDWAMLHAWRREPAKARTIAEQSLTLAKSGAFGVFTNRAELVQRWAEIELEPEISEEREEELLGAPWQSVTFGVTMPSLLYVTMCARLGRADRGLAVIEEVLASLDETEERWLEPEFHRLRGDILVKRDPLEAERSITLAMEIARKQSAASLELRAALSLHDLVSGERRPSVRPHIARLLSFIRGGEETPDIVEARRILAL